MAMKLTSGGINAVYPDSGVAAMLSYQWKPTSEGEGPLPFRITSLNDRIPVSPDDLAVVVACPDPQVRAGFMELRVVTVIVERRCLDPWIWDSSHY